MKRGHPPLSAHDRLLCGGARSVRAGELTAVVVNPTSALNCYWPMPFKRHAKSLHQRCGQNLACSPTRSLMPNTRSRAGGYFMPNGAFRTDDPPPAYILDPSKRRRYAGHSCMDTVVGGGSGEASEVYIDGDRESRRFAAPTKTTSRSYGFPKTYSTAYNGCVLKHEGKEGPPSGAFIGGTLMDPITLVRSPITIQPWAGGPPKVPGARRRCGSLRIGTKGSRTRISEVPAALRKMAR